MPPAFRNLRFASEKAQGRPGGRPTVMSQQRVEVARRMRAEQATWDTTATTLQVDVSSVRRAPIYDTVEQDSQTSSTSHRR